MPYINDEDDLKTIAFGIRNLSFQGLYELATTLGAKLEDDGSLPLDPYEFAHMLSSWADTHLEIAEAQGE